jgi:hypothetical protein
MSDETIDSLPWEKLTASHGPIPWEAIEKFCDALEHDPEVWPGLVRLYDSFVATGLKRESYEGVYIGAIVRFVAPRLDPARKAAMGRDLLKRLEEAAEDESDYDTELLLEVCQELGPAIWPEIVTRLQLEGPDNPAWYQFWNVIEERAEEAGEMRAPMADFCRAVLKRAEAGEIEAELASGAGWTLVNLREPGLEPTLKALKRSVDRGGRSDPRDNEYVYMLESLAAGQIQDFPPRDKTAAAWVERHVSRYEEWYEDIAEEEGPPSVEDMLRGPSTTYPDGVSKPIKDESPTIGRNDPCPCGSGKKYKKCCGK